MGAGPIHSMKVRSGDLEFEVSGSAMFVRQAIDDLPVIVARLRGETPPRPASISMPSVPAATPVADPETVPVSGHPVASSPVHRAEPEPAEEPRRRGRPPKSAEEPAAPARRSTTPARAPLSEAALERAIIEVLRRERRPLAVSAIRERLSDDVTGQAVRRTLERSGSVVASDERPATYRLR